MPASLSIDLAAKAEPESPIDIDLVDPPAEEKEKSWYWDIHSYFTEFKQPAIKVAKKVDPPEAKEGALPAAYLPYRPDPYTRLEAPEQDSSCSGSISSSRSEWVFF